MMVKTRKVKRSKRVAAKPVPRVAAPRRTKRRNRNRKRGVPNAMQSLTVGGATFLRAATDPFSDAALCEVGVPDEFAGRTLKLREVQTIPARPDASGVIQFSVVPANEGAIVAVKGKYSFAKPVIQTDGGVATDVGYHDPVDSFGNLKVGALIPYPEQAKIMYDTRTVLGGVPEYDAYGTEAFRVIGYGVEVRYTGTTLTNQGRIYCSRVPLHLKEGRNHTPLPVPAPTSSPYGHTDNFRAANVGNLITGDGSHLSLLPGFLVHTMSEGMMAVGVSEDADWAMKDYSRAVLTSVVHGQFSDNGTPSVILRAGNPYMGVWCEDQRITTSTKGVLYAMGGLGTQTPICVSIEGLDPAAANVEIRVSAFMEKSLILDSAFQRMTTKSPDCDPLALKTVARVSKTLPCMVPVRMNAFGDWWKKIMGFISGGAAIYSGLHLPFAPVAGAVSTLADALATI